MIPEDDHFGGWRPALYDYIVIESVIIHRNGLMEITPVNIIQYNSTAAK